jgi:uncharacterized protein
MYPRVLQLDPFIAHKSLFLLGPRQSGKSTLLRQRYPTALYVDLLASDTFRELSRYPESLGERARASPSRLIIVDEVQKLPGLLDEVQRLIDGDRGLRFVLTGSSSRKLMRGHANLLGGRALFFRLHPLVSAELDFGRLPDRLRLGSLPAVLDSPIAWEELKAYVGTYLREEIQAEGATRSIENFSRFLDFAAQFSGEQMNFTALGSDAGIPPRTVKDYVTLLEDTLVGHVLEPFRQGSKRKAVASSKFYLFDVGVTNALLGRKSVERKTPDWGRCLEQLIFLELKAYLDYRRLDAKLSYWRSRSQLEVDFVVGSSVAIEVKGAGRVGPRDLRGLQALAEETKLARQIIVCDEPHARRVGSIELLPIEEFLRALWSGEVIRESDG